MNAEPPLKTRVCEDWMIDSLSAGVLQKVLKKVKRRLKCNRSPA